MQKTARPPWFECATASSATTSWCWQLTDYRCGAEWPTFKSAQRSLRRKQDGVHRAPRRSATAISKGKTTPGSLSSLHSPISTAEEDDRALAAMAPLRAGDVPIDGLGGVLTTLLAVRAAASDSGGIFGDLRPRGPGNH